jgi:UDP-N-acetylmuramoyl-tripeptide--D-alanyl-D-alanine ligase
MGRRVIAEHARLDWTLDEIASAVGGVVVGDGSMRVDRVLTDSRDEAEGALFVALVGERFDGHLFVADVMGGGAVGVVVEAGSGVTSTPRVEVASTTQALLDLGAKRRREIDVPVVAITGSTGKTSTKDLIAAGIPGAWSSPKSYNNEVGVPLTVLATPPDASALVLEVGSRGPGHIASLAPVVAPDVSVVTNLGVAHLEMFGSRTALADAKYELVAMIASSGCAVVPADEPLLDRAGDHRRVTFGPPGATVEIVATELDSLGYPTVSLSVEGVVHRVTLSIAGEHNARNAAAAAGVAVALGLDVSGFLEGVGRAEGSDWRMDVHRGRYTVVNDAYNANPQSVEAALRAAAAMPGDRHIAVLGPMAELGSVCEDSHRAMGALARDLGYDAVVVVGPDHGYVLGAGDLVTNATDLEDGADTLRAVVRPGDVVLVKASRASGLERLALDLAQDASA